MNKQKALTEELRTIENLIREKQIDKAEEKIDKLLLETDKVEINQYGQVFDFDNEFQFVFYCKSKQPKNKVGWQRTFVSDMYQLKAVILFEKKEYDNAMKNLKLALKYNPVKTSSYLEMMEIYIRLNDFEKFKKTFDEALEIAIAPIEISIIYKKYAYFLIDLKRFEEAYNILKYTALICYRKENVTEIEYLSSIVGIKLPVNPDIGTIEYIKNAKLEYKPSKTVIDTYASLANQIEKQKLEKANNLSKEEEIIILKKLITIYGRLYFFKGDISIHKLLIRTIKEHVRMTSEKGENNEN